MLQDDGHLCGCLTPVPLRLCRTLSFPYSLNFLENTEPENNPQVPAKTCLPTSPSRFARNSKSRNASINNNTISHTKEIDRKSWAG